MLRSVKASVLILIVLSLVCSSYAEKFKKYQKKSGKIEYKLSGNSTGTSVTWWDDYGYKELQISNTTTKVWGMTNEENKKTLTIGSEVYSWKEDDDKVFKSENPIAEMWEEEEYNEEDVDEYGKDMMDELGYEKVGEEKIGGKLCEVYEGMGKMWIWKDNGLPLKTDVKILGVNIISEMTDIKLNIKVDKNLFKYPKDRQVVNEENAQELMGDDEDDEEMTEEEIKEAKEAAKNMMKSLFGN